MRLSSNDSYDIKSYIKEATQFQWEEKELAFESIFSKVRRFKRIDKNSRILEIGIGTGWIQILCAKKQIPCTGLEISADLVDTARELAATQNVTVDVKQGSIEDSDIGESAFDIIIANSTFEHVEDWKAGLANIYRALKPGGVFFFTSTNKFSFKSGEYDFPLYGWLPDKVRYRLRVKRQGPEIMKWGIDFNQFTFFQLRRFFKSLGYSKVHDVFEILDPDALANPAMWKVVLLRTIKSVPGLKYPFLVFHTETCFICAK